MWESLWRWIAANPAVGAAAVAGVTSLIVALLAHWLQPWSQRRLEILKADIQRSANERNSDLVGQVERLKAQLDDQKSAAAARRDYEYDARKRLYAEVEPLLFQLYESLEEAHYRIRSLARTARDGHLGRRDHWLGARGYYLASSVYKLLLPVVHFRLMQRRVTFVDLKLDETIALRYLLMKLYSRSFTDDFIFASLYPKLAYEPHDPPAGAAASVFARQGLLLGELESISDAMVKETDKSRAMQFAEFFAVPPGQSESIDLAMGALLGFSPEARPVLARMLLVQSCLGRLILSTFSQPAKASELAERLEAILVDDAHAAAVSWEEDQKADLSVARKYLFERLAWLQTDASWIEKEDPGSAPARPRGAVTGEDLNPHRG